MFQINAGMQIPSWLSRILPILAITYAIAVIVLGFFGIHLDPFLVINLDARSG